MGRETALIAAGLAVLCVHAGWMDTGAALAADDDTARGRDLAERLCATCHLNPGQGEKRSPTEIPGFGAVAKRPGQSLDGIVAWLRTAPAMMPKHRLSQDEMFLLATYILSLQEEK